MNGEWIVPGFRHVRQLGDGATGVVMQAEHLETGTPVAIKYLSARLLADDEFRERFAEEARLLSQVRDPALVAFHQHVEVSHGAAVIMELVDGVSLAQVINSEGPTGPEAALYVLKNSLLGLAAAHNAGIVHRDYKPGNVMVDGEGYIGLSDFGLAAPAGHDVPFPGTPAYMAPEQWGGRPVIPASDLYAATAVFYECLTGEQPYPAPSIPQLAAAHRSRPIPLADVPELLRPLVKHGLAKDVIDRPKSAAAFLSELEAIAFAAYGVGWDERGRLALSELADRLSMLFPLERRSDAATAVPVMSEAPAQQYEDFYEPEKRRRRPVAAVLAMAAILLVAVGAGTFVYSGSPGSSSAATAPTVGGSSGAATSGSPGDTGSPTGIGNATSTGTPSASPSPTTKSPSPSPTPTKTSLATPTKTASSPVAPSTFAVTGVSINVSRSTCAYHGSYSVSVSTTGTPQGSVTVVLTFSGATVNGGGSSKTVTLNAGSGYSTSGSLSGSPYSTWSGSASTTPGGKTSGDSVKGAALCL